MPRATTKTELIASADEQWDKMWRLINSMTKARQHATFNFVDNPKLKEAHWKRDRNLRDILVHLYEWHQLLLTWTATNLSGEAKPFLPEPYTWKTYGDMNVKFWEKHASTDYDDAVSMLRESHKRVLSLIESMSDNALFKKKHFTWTGTTTLGSYCISVSASHYDWAMKKITMHSKTSDAGV